jgi:hypothetical protein
MMIRREFLLGVVCAAAGTASETVQRVKVSTEFKSPGPHPNGLQCTHEGLWILDQGDNRAYLVNYDNGRVLRALDTESKAGSGITFDGEALWLASTYSREIIRADAHTGRTLAKYPCPGAGIVAWTAGRRSPLAAKEPPAPQPSPAAPRQATGAHGLEWKNGRLWIAVPPAQKIYRVNPKGFAIEQQFATAGDRPHGLGWEGEWLWCVDSNMNAMLRHDTTTGKWSRRIQLSDTDPLPHGMSIRNGTVWYCDDVGVVCRFALP